MIYIGIDNGLSGAIVGIDEDGNIVERETTPTVKLKTAKGGARQAFDFAAIAAIVASWHLYERVLVCLEKGQPLPPKMRGGNADFSAGMSFGMWQAMLAAFQVPYVIVSAQRWQSRMINDEPGTDSGDRAISRAKRLMPSVNWCATEKSRKPHGGLVDAYMLAEYARRYESVVKAA